MHRGDRSLLAEPYTARRVALEDLGLEGERVRTPPWFRDDPEAVLVASRAQGLEGVVGKPLDSPYVPGRRGPWIKVKHPRHQEVIVVGWTEGKGRRAGRIGALLLDVYDDHGLRYVGKVGTGFTHTDLENLAERLRPLHRRTSPLDTSVPAGIARTAQWVEPKLVGEVDFAEWTNDELLRQPSWRGLRPDKQPEQVHREEPR